MEKSSTPLEKIISYVLADVKEKSLNDLNYVGSVAKYTTLLRNVIDNYHHHQGEAIYDDDLASRFLYETALLHTVTQVMSHIVVTSHGSGFSHWPVQAGDSVFSWYTLPAPLIDEINILASELESENLALNLLHFSDYMLSNGGKRYLGEYYTPAALAEHLIDLSYFEPQDIYTNRRIVDPACGGGMILASIANRVLAFGYENKIPLEITCEVLTNNIYGFDIQPFAVIFTRTLMQFICSPVLINFSDRYDEKLLFPNITLLDPLANSGRFWMEDRLKFSYIVGNPPFMSVKKKAVSFVEEYEEVLGGHPNLYVLFLWWAVKSLSSDGKISFLLPQSLLSGSFFIPLRKKLYEKTRLLAVTRMIDRTGIIGDADQQMMAVSLRKVGSASNSEQVTIRVARNSTDLGHVKAYLANHDSVVQKSTSSTTWVVSDNALDYEISERLEDRFTTVEELNTILRCGNGSFVWNQNKDLLRTEQEPNTIPLVSSASIDMYTFEFPYIGSHSTHTRPYAYISEKVKNRVHFGDALLIKRTTPTKVGRRLIAGMLSREFYDIHPTYFLENHVNYIKVVDDTNTKILYGLMGWMNSDLINFIFQLRNGTTQVSVHEIKLLPVDTQVLETLTPMVLKICVEQSIHERTAQIAELNKELFSWLGLKKKHISRIETVLSRKERINSI